MQTLIIDTRYQGSVTSQYAMFKYIHIVKKKKKKKAATIHLSCLDHMSVVMMNMHIKDTADKKRSKPHGLVIPWEKQPAEQTCFLIYVHFHFCGC